MASLKIRSAEANEADLVYRMIQSLAEAVGEADKFVARLEDVLRDAFGPGRRYEAWLAWLDGRPAGLLSCYQTYSTYRGRPCLFVDNLYVEDWARGQAVGRSLMAQAATLALEKDCCRLDLHVRRDNRAQEFYQAIGLSLCDELYYSIPAADFKALTNP